MNIIVDVDSGMHEQPGTVGIDCHALPAYF
jgi:hypothetical protein